MFRMAKSSRTTIDHTFQGGRRMFPQEEEEEEHSPIRPIALRCLPKEDRKGVTEGGGGVGRV